MVVVVKRLNVLTTYREYEPHTENMVIGKLKYLMEPAVEYTPHCLVYGHARVQGTLGRWACFMPGEKGEKSRG